MPRLSLGSALPRRWTIAVGSAHVRAGINDVFVLEGMIAQGFGTEVERFHGAKSGSSYNSATQLVDAKLEVVRAGRLLQYFDIVRRFCWRDRADRLRRDEIY